MKFIPFVFTLFICSKLLAQNYELNPVRIAPSDFLANGAEPVWLTPLKNDLYFAACANRISAYKLYRIRQKDTMAEELFANRFTDLQSLSVAGNKLLIVAKDSAHGNEIWVSDGSDSGTSLLADLTPGTGSSGIGRLQYHSGYVYFIKDISVSQVQLWRCGLSGQGAQMLVDSISRFMELGFVAQKMVFTARISSNRPGLYACDPDGSALIRLRHATEISPYYFPGFTLFNNKLYLGWEDSTDGNQLWVTDATVQGTRMVKRINPSGSSYPHELIVFDSRLCFTANDGVNGFEVWSSDGSESGTKMLSNLNPHLFARVFREFTIYRNRLYFTLNNGIGGDEVWSITHAPTSARMLKDINPGSDGSESRQLSVYNDKLFFLPLVGDLFHLWMSDGSDPGTKRIPFQNDLPYDALYFGMNADICTTDSALYLPVYSGSRGFMIARLGLRQVSALSKTPINKSILLYPNPASGNTVHFNKQLSGVLTDVRGLEHIRFEQTDVLNIGSLENGIYILKTDDGQMLRLLVLK